MNSFKIIILLILFPLSVFSFTDETHYSKTFGETRHFRVFTPINYNAANNSKRYPVIYYFHGCGGSYRKDGTYSYSDYSLKEPVAIGRTFNEDYHFPSNADFENIAHNNDVIIISVDGKIKGMPKGCQVYFPSQADSWDGGYYNFSAYIKELIEVVDTRYNTKTGPQFRAVSGLSMGGQIAIWLAATNPHLFSSASEFCHSPSFFDVGDPAYQTAIDVQQLWRNLRGLPFRHSTNSGDYLKYYTSQLYETYSGAGFENENYLTDYCKHAAARSDLQFDFHLKHFSKTKEIVSCFSNINLYPNFEVWGYKVTSSKKGNGWIYLHDVTKNGLGIYTRERLPWGKSLPEFGITVTTPANYIPNETYSLSRYSYHDQSFSSEKLKADTQGKLIIRSSEGQGEEIGIVGKDLQPPVFVLMDTINENIYLKDLTETPLSYEVINLSKSAQTIDFTISTENKDIITIVENSKQVTIPALSKVTVNSFFTIKGKYAPDYKNTGFIKIGSSINGIVQDREQIIRVIVKKQDLISDTFGIKIFDGRSEDLSIFKYAWGKWDDPITSGNISEGIGNGNGKPEMGETFSIWIQTPSLFESKDISTWHPTVLINNKDNPDIIFEGIKKHRYNTGRSSLSAQMKLTRKPTKKNPIKIPIQVDFLIIDSLENDCHRNKADKFDYSYFDLVLHEDGSVVLEKNIRKGK